MTNELTTLTPNATVTTTSQYDAVAAAGRAANHYAAADAFTDYKNRRPQNTLDAQLCDLDTFAEFLCVATDGADCPVGEDLQTKPLAWSGVTWGLVEAFKLWLLDHGYAISTINRKLATIHVYSNLAVKAGIIDQTEGNMIHLVKGYAGKEAKHIDERRDTTRRPGRGADGKGAKKAAHVSLDLDQATALKRQPDTPQGRRDAVIMALLLDHGLREGELVALDVSAFKLERNAKGIVTDGVFTFYRPKVDKIQTHRLTADALRVVAAWLNTDANAMGPLLRGSRKGGKLTNAGMTERAIAARVAAIGLRVGIEGLSPHDCRHYWATRAAAQGTDPFALRDAGGWSSMAMPSRYVEAAKIANERVKL